MKLLLLCLIFSGLAFAAPSPFHPYEKVKFDALDAADTTNTAAIAANTLITAKTSDLTALASADGIGAKRVARATWDFAVDGGAVSAIDLGVTIPAKALINFAYFYTVTQVTDAGTGTGALHCEDADNLYAAADVTGNAAKVVVLGVPQNSAATMVKDIAASCNLTWTIAGTPATAGKLIFFVEYTIVE